MGWRLTHNTTASLAVLSLGSGLFATWGHVQLSFALIPAWLWLSWRGRRALLGSRRGAPLHEANRWLARLLFVDLALLIVSGVLLWDADPRHPLTVASYRALHGIATDLFLPALLAHIGVGAWLRRSRRQNLSAS